MELLYNFLSVETILLFGFLFGQLVQFYNMKYNKLINLYSQGITFLGCFSAIVVFPILEESVFRCTLPSIFGDNFYIKIICSIIFGLIHLFNIRIINNWIIIFYQSIITMFLGYYLTTFSSLLYMIIFHSLYNLISIAALIGMIYIIDPKCMSKTNNMVDMWKYSYTIKKDKLRKCMSESRINKGVKEYGNEDKYINIDKINNKIKGSVMKLQDRIYKNE